MAPSNNGEATLTSPLPIYDESRTGVLISGMRHALVTGAYTDLTITAASTDFKVHRMIMCTQSPFLAKALDGRFKVSISTREDIYVDDNLTSHRSPKIMRYIWTISPAALSET